MLAKPRKKPGSMPDGLDAKEGPDSGSGSPKEDPSDGTIFVGDLRIERH